MTENTFARLEAWLSSPALEGRAMRIDKLQGFLCAVASSPDIIPPSRWMPAALGGEIKYETLEQTNDATALLMSFYNNIASSLHEHLSPQLILKPISSVDKSPDYQTWCNGYILGWSLSTEEWLRRGNEPLKNLTFPILLLSGAFKEDAELKGEEMTPDDEYAKASRDCAEMLPQVVLGIYNFWLSKRKSIPLKREASKLGRNDPCPCGSGKKFKQCCGKAPTIH